MDQIFSFFMKICIFPLDSEIPGCSALFLKLMYHLSSICYDPCTYLSCISKICWWNNLSWIPSVCVGIHPSWDWKSYSCYTQEPWVCFCFLGTAGPQAISQTDFEAPLNFGSEFPWSLRNCCFWNMNPLPPWHGPLDHLCIHVENNSLHSWEFRVCHFVNLL